MAKSRPEVRYGYFQPARVVGVKTACGQNRCERGARIKRQSSRPYVERQTFRRPMRGIPESDSAWHEDAVGSQLKDCRVQTCISLKPIHVSR